MSESLRFNKDGTFKILVATDIHENHKFDSKSDDALSLLKNAVEKLKPDLVVFNGDNAVCSKDKDAEIAVEKIIAPVKEKNIPLAVVFGNHDAEFGVSKEFLLKQYQKYDNCLMIAGDENIDGVGNYNILIKSSDDKRDVFNLWFIDSGMYAEEGGYDYVHDNQIEWYERTARELAEKNGGMIPAILFQHITVPEEYDLLEGTKRRRKSCPRGHRTYSDRYWSIKDKNNTVGELREGPCPPDRNNGQFESWVKTGDIIGAVFGHDHINDFTGTYKGIRLMQTRAVGFRTYTDGVSQGVRLITLHENDVKNFDTEMVDFTQLVGKSKSIKGFKRIRRAHIGKVIASAVTAGIIAAAAIVITLIK